MFNDPQGRSSSAPAQGKRERPWVSVALPWSHPPEDEEGRTLHSQLSLPGGDSAALWLGWGHKAPTVPGPGVDPLVAGVLSDPAPLRPRGLQLATPIPCLGSFLLLLFGSAVR